VPSALAPLAAVHASHAPLQAALQQTPSRQVPPWHWRSRAQLAPVIAGLVVFGAIVVRTETITGTIAPSIVVSVADEGGGMDARAAERAFDDFFTTKAAGSGLGLAFVRRVALAHGGEVSMTTDVGRGTTVRLHLPLEA